MHRPSDRVNCTVCGEDLPFAESVEDTHGNLYCSRCADAVLAEPYEPKLDPVEVKR